MYCIEIKQLNFGVITLVPKIKEANTILESICLVNVDYKGCVIEITTKERGRSRHFSGAIQAEPLRRRRTPHPRHSSSPPLERTTGSRTTARKVAARRCSARSISSPPHLPVPRRAMRCLWWQPAGQIPAPRPWIRYLRRRIRVVQRLV